MFSNQYLAYDLMSDTYKDMLEGLYAVHSAQYAYGREEYNNPNSRSISSGMNIKTDSERRATRHKHPIVRTHPEIERKALNVNESFTIGIDGMTEDESDAILRYLVHHSVHADICCSFRWERGSVVFWGNRCLQHHALNDYPGRRREMWSLTINGDRPF